MIDFEAMSIAELIETRASLDAAIEKRRKELELQLRKLSGNPAPVAQSQDRAAASKPDKKRGGSGKAKPMYRHPQTGEEWSGRGRPARWLALEMAAGKKKEEFRI
jgi:DNA-binding protein H-NS